MGYLNHSTAATAGTNSNSVVIDTPSGTADGDLMIWVIHADFSADGTTHYTFPVGWTQIPSTNGETESTVDEASLAVAYKVASSEAATQTCTLFQADWWVSTIVTYDNCPASPYDTNAVSAADSTADATPWDIGALSLSTAQENEIVLWIGAIDVATSQTGITYTVPADFTQRGSTIANANWCSMAIADKVFASSGATGDISGSASGTGNAGQMAMLVAIKQNAAAAQTAAPTSDITSGWTPSTGATLYGTIDEASPGTDTDYDYTGSAATMEVKFASLTDPSTYGSHQVKYRIASASTGTLTVSLRQGSSQIASWSHSPPPSAITTYTGTLTSAEAESITDYTDLRLRVVSST